MARLLAVPEHAVRELHPMTRDVDLILATLLALILFLMPFMAG